jgi:hypothetical protein
MSATEAAVRSGRWRGPVARLLTIVGVLLVVVSVAANYVERQALDTDNFKTTAEQLIDDPAIQAQIAQSLTDQLFSSVDVQAQLEEVLPPDQKGLAGPITGALRPVAERLANRILDRPRFQEIWVAALVGTQKQIVRILDDETKFLQTENGAVVIDLRQLLKELAEQLPIAPGLADKIPPDKGVIHLFDAEQVDTAQTVTRVLRAVADWIWVLALAAWIGAVVIARDRRKELRAIAIGFVAVGFLLLLARRVAGRYLVDQIGQAASSSEDAVRESWDIITSLLADAAWAVIVVGVIALLGIWVAGPGRRGTQVRAWLAPHLQRWEVAYGSAAFVFLLLLLWGPISYVRKPSTVIVFAVLAALGVEALRRQVARESSPVSPASGSPPG